MAEGWEETVGSSSNAKDAHHGVERLLYSRREAAEALGISERTLRYLDSKGVLKSRRIGKRCLYAVNDLRQFAGQGG